MTETDLQLGGGYVYQWECAILLALNYFFEPVRYNSTLFDLVDEFLCQVEEIHLEGEDQESGIDLEDINLAGGDQRILVQVKTKQAEGERWTPTDPLLLKALYRFYDSRFFAERPEDVRFVFLTNRPFNPALVRVKEAINTGALDGCAEVDILCRHLADYAKREKKTTLDPNRFRQVLACTALVEYLGVDEVKANVQAKLQARGRHDWQQAYDSLFAHFTRQSTRVGGGVVTRDSVIEVLEVPLEAPSPALSAPINTDGGAYIAGNVTVGGNFIGRDYIETRPATAPMPPARPKLPKTDDPLGLIVAAIKVRRFLLVWADVLFPPTERPTSSPALAISRWQAEAQALLTPSLPLVGLPPCTILSLDPTDRIECAFQRILHTRIDVVVPGQHNLIKLGGDLETRSGLLLSWDDVRDAVSDPVKLHLLQEARRVAQEGVVLVAGEAPTQVFATIWDGLIAPYLREAAHHFAVGPVDFAWPAPLQHIGSDFEGILAALKEG